MPTRRASSRSATTPALATMLIAAAHKELGGTPIELKLEYPAIPEAQAAVPSSSRRSATAGLPWGSRSRPIEVPESQLESELRAGRTFDLAYRVAAMRRAGPRGGPPALPGLRRPPRDRRPGVGRQHPDPPVAAPARTRRPSSPRPGAWPSRSTASRATSSRCCRSGRWSITTPGGRG